MKFNMGKLIESHKKTGGIRTISLKEFEVSSPYGQIEVDNNSNIKRFTEKPTFLFSANAGIYVFKPKIFQYNLLGQVVSLEKETFPILLENGEKLNGWYEEAYLTDVGTITGFDRVNKELLPNFIHK